MQAKMTAYRIYFVIYCTLIMYACIVLPGMSFNSVLVVFYVVHITQDCYAHTDTRVVRPLHAIPGWKVFCVKTFFVLTLSDCLGYPQILSRKVKSTEEIDESQWLVTFILTFLKTNVLRQVCYGGQCTCQFLSKEQARMLVRPTLLFTSDSFLHLLACLCDCLRSY